MDMNMNWDDWVEAALSKLESLKLLRSLRPINVSNNSSNFHAHEYKVFDGLREWDRTSVEVMISESTFRNWLNDIPSCGIFLSYPLVFSRVLLLFLWVYQFSISFWVDC